MAWWAPWPPLLPPPDQSTIPTSRLSVQPLPVGCAARILEEKGAEGLEPAYEALLRQPGAPRHPRWFAGYASLAAAEFQRRAGKAQQALAAYERAVEHYEQCAAVNPDTRDTCDHYIALVLAGRARLELERGDLERATADILTSLARKPEAAATHDGLGLSPVATARMLLAQLHRQEQEGLAAQVDAALNALDPALLELPAYEREEPAREPQRRRSRLEG